MADDEEYVTERWTATGTRLTDDGTRASSWLDPSGEELLYKDRGSYAIGATYEATIRRADGHRYRRGVMKFAGRDEQDPAQVAVWEAQTHAAEVEVRHRARERKLKRQSALDEALRPLVRIASELHTSRDREALAAYVLRKILYGGA